MHHKTNSPGIKHCLASFILVISIFICNESMSQNVAINTDGSKADLNAIVDIKSTNKGLLIPRMTTAQRMKIPQTTGLMVYDVTTKSFWYSNGESWHSIASTDAPVTTTDAWLLTGNAGTVDNVNFLGTIDNVPLNFRVNNEKAGRIDANTNNTFFGHRAGMNVTVGGNNTAVGSSALLANTSGTGNTGVGTFSLSSNTSGQNNTGIGAGSLLSNTTGSQNTSLGVNSLRARTASQSNTAVGFSAMENATNGNENVAVGIYSMYFNEGSRNTAVGDYTLHSGTNNDNTAVGYEALRQPTTGSRNVAIGVSAMFSNRSGQENTAIGYEALRFNTTGNQNTAVGRRALRTNDNGIGNTAIGNDALFNNSFGQNNVAGGQSSLRNNVSGTGNTAYGYFSLLSNNNGYGNVGIGSEALETNVDGFFNTALGTAADVLFSTLNNATAIGYNAKVDKSNKVRIGNAAVTVIEGQVPFTTPSDGRYKYNVKEDVHGLDFILHLRPVTYQFDVQKFDGINSSGDGQTPSKFIQASYDEASKVRRSGFIAQEVETAAIQSGYNFSGIIKPTSEKEHYSLSYESFVVPLVKAIQEQQELIKSQNKRMEEQDKKINLLIQELEQLKQKVSQ